MGAAVVVGAVSGTVMLRSVSVESVPDGTVSESTYAWATSIPDGAPLGGPSATAIADARAAWGAQLDRSGGSWKSEYTNSIKMRYMDFAVEAVVAEVGELRFNSKSGAMPLGEELTWFLTSPWNTCVPLRLVITGVVASRHEEIPYGFTACQMLEMYPLDAPIQGGTPPQVGSDTDRLFEPRIRLEALYDEPKGLVLAMRSRGVQVGGWCLGYAEAWAETLSTAETVYEAIELVEFNEYQGDDVYNAAVPRRVTRQQLLDEIEAFW